MLCRPCFTRKRNQISQKKRCDDLNYTGYELASTAYKKFDFQSVIKSPNKRSLVFRIKSILFESGIEFLGEQMNAPVRVDFPKIIKFQGSGISGLHISARTKTGKHGQTYTHDWSYPLEREHTPKTGGIFP